MKKYPKMKYSGVEWMGEVPEHWQISKIKFLPSNEPLSFIDGDWIESKDIIFESTIRYITTGNIGEGRYKEQGYSFISEETFSRLNCTEVFPGDLLISRLNNPIGRSCIIPKLGFRIVTSVDNVILRPKKEFDKLYLNFLMNNEKYYEFTDLIARGATMQRISRGLLAGIKLCIPPLAEQLTIAHYLDQKTTQIDQTIAEKEKLIELFREERQAIINHAVTKGIRAGVNMKDSGVAWMGEMPEGWEIKRLKHVAVINPPKGSSEFDLKSEELVTFLSMENVSPEGKIDCSIKKAISTLVTGYTYFEKNDIIIAKITPCFENGKGAMLTELDTTFGFGSTEFHVLRATQSLIKEFLFFITRTELFMQIGEAFMVGSAGQKRVPTSFIENWQFGLPPLPEQTAIAHYLDQKTTQIDQAIHGIRQEIALLQEYRQALIFEAVTGKIKVYKDDE